MKKILTITLTAFLLAVSSCQKYDDSALWTELEAQAKRLAALEAWQATVNGNITALQGLVNSLNQRYITDVSAFTTPEPGGYTISFNTGAPLYIYNGNNGAKGDKGDTGNKGDKGDTGATPQIGVKEEPAGSGVYYWTLNGNWLLDGGQKIRVTGDKGDTGNNGDKGDTGVTPQLRINATDFWEICTNGTCANAADWTSTGVKATGPQGEQGAQGDAIFAANGVNATHNDYVVFTLANGETITLLKYKNLDIVFAQPAMFNWSETKTVGFTTSGNATAVKVLDVPADWTISVTRSGSAGTLTVTAPARTETVLEALVLVSDAAGNTLWRTLRLMTFAAASAQTWTFGSSPIVWSDAIQLPECNKTSFTSSTNTPQCRSYTLGTNTWYYYNTTYYKSLSDRLCPTPWKVAGNSDYTALRGNTTAAQLVSVWGAGGYVTDSGVYAASTHGHLWSNYSPLHTLTYSAADGFVYNTYYYGSQGFQVRCVK
jgi:hypothetical protein